MRDPARIDKILKVVKTYWKRNPDLRLCQLLGNCFGFNDLYYVEDEVLVKEIEEAYNGRLNNE
jgi:uncharacterized protein YihD (DUF1040 family)